MRVNTVSRTRLIYGLVDPRSGALRYVGRSLSGLRRPRQHWQPRHVRAVRSHTANWVRELVALGLRPDVELLEIEPDDVVEAEQFYIAYFRSLGCRLTNHTKGGDGMIGYRHSEETKRKISEAKRGIRPSAEQLEKNRLAQFGRKHSDETRRKISLANSKPRPAARKPKSLEHRRNIGEALRSSAAFRAYHAARSAGRVATFH
jgi:hypothetical protein